MKVVLRALAVLAIGSLGPVARPGSHCLLPAPVGYAMAMAAQQSPPSPPDGNPGHQEPAPGANCTHDPRDPAHHCTCHRECKDVSGEDDQGNQTQTTVVQEDPKCRVYCFKDRCACPIENCE